VGIIGRSAVSVETPKISLVNTLGDENDTELKTKKLPFWLQMALSKLK